MPIRFSLKTLLSSAIGIASTTVAFLFWNDTWNKSFILSTNNHPYYNNDNIHPQTMNTNNTPFNINVDNHHVLMKGNWVIMISTEWTPLQDKHLQWWKDSQMEYNRNRFAWNCFSMTTNSQRDDDCKNSLRFAYIDGVANPELVALLQVREYPSIRLVTNNGTQLRTFNRALLLTPSTFTQHLKNWGNNLVMWNEFGGINGWGKLYTEQVRMFNLIWGGMQYWQIKLIDCIREEKIVVIGIFVGMIIGRIASHRLGYLQPIL